MSYVSDDPKYRGADNDDTHDSDYLCQLGKPVTNLPIADLAAYARKNGSRWMANERVAIFVVGALMRVYFHNGSIQVPFDPNPDANGLHRGGLGMGIDCESGSWWSGYNGYRPYWKQNVGIEKGDFTGLLSTTIELSDGTTQTIGNIPCFMGLKNWYKSLYVMEEDSLLICNANKTQSMYVKKVIDGTAPSLDSTTGLQLVGSTPAHESGSWSYIKRFSKAYLSGMPTLDGGTEDTFYGDGYYNPAVTDGSVRGCFRRRQDLCGDAVKCGLFVPQWQQCSLGLQRELGCGALRIHGELRHRAHDGLSVNGLSPESKENNRRKTVPRLRARPSL